MNKKGNTDGARSTLVTAVAGDGAWLLIFRRYISAIAVANLAWEVAQLPLYTIWTEGTAGEITFAVLHCTAGGVLIARTCLLGALLLFGTGDWPFERHGLVATVSTAAGVAFTVHSEWRNVEVHGNWAYSEWVPTLPVLGTGLSPLAQWIIVPTAAFLVGTAGGHVGTSGHDGSVIAGGR